MPFRQRIARHLGETVSSSSTFKPQLPTNRRGYKPHPNMYKAVGRDSAKGQSSRQDEDIPRGQRVQGRVTKNQAQRFSKRSLTKIHGNQLSPEQKYLSCKQ